LNSETEVEMILVEAQNLSKSYGDRSVALADCSFQITSAISLALIGANGAGKTTLLNLLLQTMCPTTGWVSWFGGRFSQNRSQIYSEIAFVPEEHRFYPSWTGQQTVNFVRSFHQNWNEEREKFFGDCLKIPLHQKMSTYSKGNLTKLSLLMALSQGAKILIFDEPFSGLDPLVREELLSAISLHLQESHSALILTSHDLFAVEALATELWILHRGHFLFQGALSTFLARYESFTLKSLRDASLPGILTRSYFKQTYSDTETRTLRFIARPELREGLNSLSWDFQLEADSKPPSLYDCYAACVHAALTEVK